MTTSATHTHAPTPQRPCLLIIDDDPDILELLNRVFGAHDFRVHTFERPAEAIRHLPQIRPDAVLLDISMPVVSGFTVARSILQWSPHSVIVFISALAGSGHQLRAWQTGAAAFLPKPLDAEATVRKVRQLLNRDTSTPPTVVVGVLLPNGWPALLQEVSTLGPQLRIRIDAPDGTTASLWLEQGRIADAQVERLRGRAALETILAIDSGVVRVSIEPPPGLPLGLPLPATADKPDPGDDDT